MDNVNLNTKIEKVILESNGKFIENDLRPFLRIPSNTLNREGINKAKKFILSHISEIAEDVKEYTYETNPLILAKVEGKIEDSLLIYMMYDTQPADKEEEWICDPFAAEINVIPSPLDVLGKCIIARGAYNSKSPLMCFLNVVKELKRTNELPISLLLLFDGEEEIGSPTLTNFLDKNKIFFESCIDAYYPATKQDLNGTSILKLGYKGVLSLSFNVYTHNKEPHSSFSGMIPNPAIDLISLLNTIYSNNQFLINSLKATYELTEEENEIMDDLMMTLDLENIKNKAGITETTHDDSKTAFTNYLFKPTFNISTIKSGYQEKGIKNMVANQALCNIDIRFAHNVSINGILNEIEEKVEAFSKTSKSNVEMIKNIGYEGARVKKSSILVKSLVESAKMLNFESEIWPLSAAAAPLSMIQRKLGLNFIVGGLGIGGFAHSPNEFIQHDSIINTRLSYLYFLKIYSELIKQQN